MKLRKLLVALLAVVMAVGVATAFAACGDGDKPDDKKPANDKSYQLSGEFRDNLQVLGDGFDFMLDLNVDGSAVLARYNPFSYDASDAATNANYTAEFMKGTWKAAQKDGVDCLQIKLACHLKDGTTEGDTTVYAYAVAGEYSVDIDFPVVPGQGVNFSRKVTVKGGETKTYADGNAFIAAKKMTFTAPASETTFTAKGQGGNTVATLYVQKEGKVLAYFGYSKIAEGTYTKSSSAMKVVLGDSAIDVTIADNKGSFKYSYDMGYGDPMELTFACDDLTKVPDFGDADFEPVTYTGTYKGTEYSIMLTSATECTYTGKMSYQGNTYPVSFACTYTIAKDVIALTVKQEPTGMEAGAWPGMKAITWTLNKDKTMTGAVKYVSTNEIDINMMGNASKSKLSVSILDDTNCKFTVEAAAGYGMGIFDCTYTRTGNDITIAIKAEPEANSVSAGLWNTVKTMLTWTLDDTTHTMTVKA